MYIVLLLIAWLAAMPANAEELVLSSIADGPTHARLWRINQEVLKRAGHQARLRAAPAERALRLADSGATDGDVGRSYGIEANYPNLVRVPEPILEFSIYAYAFEPLDTSAGMEPLRKQTVCIRRGIKIFETRTEGMARRILEDDRALLRMLRAGGCRFALFSPLPDLMEAAMKESPPLLRIEPKLETVPVFLYLHKRHAGLVPGIAAAVREMRADGSLRKLQQD